MLSSFKTMPACDRQTYVMLRAKTALHKSMVR